MIDQSVESNDVWVLKWLIRPRPAWRMMITSSTVMTNAPIPAIASAVRLCRRTSRVIHATVST